MEEPASFAPLLLVVVLAFLVPILLSRIRGFRLPIVVGEILAGILVGKSVFGLVESNDPVLQLLAEFGFVFLMFLSGMEIDFSRLKPSGSSTSQTKKTNSWLPASPGPLPLGAVSFGITLLMAGLIGFGLVTLDLAKNPWMMALILSTTSLGVVVPVLKENGLISGRFGQTMLIASLIADFATMLLITVLVAAISKGLTFEILLIGMLFVAFFLFYQFGRIFFNRVKAVRIAMEELSHATAQIKVRLAFMVMLIFVVLAQVLGAEVILGAFLAGAIVALLRTPADADLTPQLEAIGYGFFIPIFFIWVGLSFNLSALTASSSSILLVPLLLLAAFLVKFVPLLVFRLSFSWRETLAAGALLSSRLSLIIAASAIGLRLGLIRESVNSAIILVAILLVTFSPVLFLRILGERGQEKKSPIVVVGAGELGLNVAQGLCAHREAVLVVDSDLGRVERARQLGMEALQGEPENPDEALSTYMDEARALVCTYNDISRTYSICRHARQAFAIPYVVAQVSNPGELSRFEEMGVVPINAALDRAALLVMMTRNPALYDLLTRTDDNKEVAEVAVRNPAYFGAVLRRISLPGDVLVLALRRNGDLLVPHGNTVIEEGDHVTLAGGLDYIEEARRLFIS